MIVLTGSRAMRHWYPDAREPKGDWDYISDGSCQFAGPRIDIFTDPRLGAWTWGAVATADELYTLKVSHGSWEVNGPRGWDKHAADIVFMSRHGAQFLRPLHDIVRPVWEDRYKPGATSLAQGKAAFFADAVARKYDHDSLHESVAYGARPLFESILKPGEEVAVDSRKFFAMDHATQMMLVREEIYATALERKLIPAGYQGSPGAAYWWALRRTATSLFKGEWSLFLLRNLDELSRPDCDYLGRHLSSLHVLRPIGENDHE